MLSDEEKEKLNKTINELCEVLGFTTPLNIMKVAAATTDLFYGLQKENEALKQSVAEAEEIIAELKAHCKAVDEVNEKMKCCGNCKYWNVKLGFDSKCKLIEPCNFGKRDRWELAE